MPYEYIQFLIKRCTGYDTKPYPVVRSSLGFLVNLGTLFDYHIYQPLRSGRIWHKVYF